MGSLADRRFLILSKGFDRSYKPETKRYSVSVQSRPLRVFISYSHQDDQLRQELEKHLIPSMQTGQLLIWSDRQIDVGSQWWPTIRDMLKTSDIILLLISKDFLASEFINNEELKPAMTRHETGQARVIPIFLRHCNWEQTEIKKLQGIPKDAKPIMSWRDRDEAFTVVTREIFKVAEALAREKTRHEVEEQARKEDEANAQQETQEHVQQEAKARQVAEERAYQAKERFRQESKARHTAEEQARQEEQTRRAVEERFQQIQECLQREIKTKQELKKRLNEEIRTRKAAQGSAQREAEARRKAEDLIYHLAKGKRIVSLWIIRHEVAAITLLLLTVFGMVASVPQVQRSDFTVFRDAPFAPEMVVLPVGEFLMGSPNNDNETYNDEKPQHQVQIRYRLAVGRYPITFDEWDAFMTDGGTDYQPNNQGWGRGRRPVINISWDNAKQYVAWLSRKTGQTYRLLSEAEWEYAARAGTTTSRWWGNDITPQNANYGDSKIKKTTEVGSYSESPFKLYDILGNVWEWIEDCWNENYKGAPEDGVAWTTGDCSERVLRGGSWKNDSRDIRSASRTKESVNSQVIHIYGAYVVGRDPHTGTTIVNEDYPMPINGTIGFRVATTLSR